MPKLFYVPESDAHTLRQIAAEKPTIMRDAMREATEVFVTSQVLQDNDQGKNAWELDRPPYERWAEQGVAGFAIRNNFNAGPRSSRIFSQAEL